MSRSDISSMMYKNVCPNLPSSEEIEVGRDSKDAELNLINKTGDTNMTHLTTARRTVTVELIDPDKGLPVEKSLVMTLSGVVTEDNDEVTIREVLMKEGVADKVDAHNKMRSGIINEDILERTGNEVKLRPIKLKNLQWVVKQ